MMKSFGKLCEYLENYGDCYLYTLKEFHKMIDKIKTIWKDLAIKKMLI